MPEHRLAGNQPGQAGEEWTQCPDRRHGAAVLMSALVSAVIGLAGPGTLIVSVGRPNTG
jgi:hypothetical protein